MKGYKVFYRESANRNDYDGGLVSTNGVRGKYMLHYRKGVKTEAPGNTGLLLFANYKDALDFVMSYLIVATIWKVKCDALISLNEVCARIDENTLKSFWSAVKGGYNPAVSTFAAPPGTRYCNWVIPVKEVKSPTIK